MYKRVWVDTRNYLLDSPRDFFFTQVVKLFTVFCMVIFDYLNFQKMEAHYKRV